MPTLVFGGAIFFLKHITSLRLQSTTELIVAPSSTMPAEMATVAPSERPLVVAARAGPEADGDIKRHTLLASSVGAGVQVDGKTLLATMAGNANEHCGSAHASSPKVMLCVVELKYTRARWSVVPGTKGTSLLDAAREVGGTVNCIMG